MVQFVADSGCNMIYWIAELYLIGFAFELQNLVFAMETCHYPKVSGVVGLRRNEQCAAAYWACGVVCLRHNMFRRSGPSGVPGPTHQKSRKYFPAL
jgi:hypothetical protein